MPQSACDKMSQAEPLIGSASREGKGRGEKREARISKGEEEEKRGTTHVACLRTNGNLGLPFPSGMCGGSSNERTKCTMHDTKALRPLAQETAY